nr:hypothetical protein [Tanacetum cinerariifolium]
MYDSWKTRFWLYIKGKENGETLLDSINKGPFQLKAKITVPSADGTTKEKHVQTVVDLSPKEKLRYDSDIKAVSDCKRNIGLGKSQATGTRVINIVGEENANQLRVIRCYNCKGEGHMGTTKKKVKDSKRFKEKTLLAQVQEAGVVLHEDQQDFINDRLEEMEDCDDLELQTTSNFKVDPVDAYDSDCDDKATASAIFMASLSPAGSLTDDTVTPTYDSYILFEVLTYDNYHENDMLNFVVQGTEYI